MVISVNFQGLEHFDRPPPPVGFVSRVMHAGEDPSHFADVIIIERWNKLTVFELRVPSGLS